MKKLRNGFSLIEVLVFTSILSLFFVAAATVATVSLRNLKSAENKILATRYAEELLEWLRGEKEEDWSTFDNKSSVEGTNWCFTNDNDPIESWPLTSGLCGTNDYSLKGIFKRWTNLKSTTINGSPAVNISITIEWIDAGGQIKSVPIKTVFTQFE